MLESGAAISRFAAERQCLVDWFKKRDAVLPTSYCRQFGPVSSGAEHSVYYDLAGFRAVKITHPNGFGHSVYQVGARATPLEYFRRLGLHNHFFGDDIRLLGCVLEEEGAIQIVSSQPWVTASSNTPTASDAQIDAYLSEIKFRRSQLFSDGAVFFNPNLRLVIADARSGNVLVTEGGDIMPIDLVIGLPSKELEALLRAELPQNQLSSPDDVSSTLGSFFSNTQIEIDFS